MKIHCRTYFDCSPTGVTGHYRVSSIPFLDFTGKNIENQSQWNYARNQQRNWETINQLISLRTQPNNIEPAKKVKESWEFTFEVEDPFVYSTTGQQEHLGSLIDESNGVPMITGLEETQHTDSTLITSGPDQNIWFTVVNNQQE